MAEYALKYLGRKPEVRVSGPHLERSYLFGAKTGYTAWVTADDMESLMRMNPKMFAVVGQRSGSRTAFEEWHEGRGDEEVGDLTAMTKEQLRVYAAEHFGVLLNMRESKAVLVARVRRLLSGSSDELVDEEKEKEKETEREDEEAETEAVSTEEEELQQQQEKEEEEMGEDVE